MHFDFLNRRNIKIAALLLAAILTIQIEAQTAAPTGASSNLPAAPQRAVAQTASQDYSKAPSQFPDVIAPYKPVSVPPPNLGNTARVDQLMHDGKILLSINDAV